MELRDYQQTAYKNTMTAFEGNQAALVVLATGLGKTVIASHIAKNFTGLGRVMLLAHREELIFQGKRTLERVTGLDAEVEMADNWARKSSLLGGGDIVVSTIQTQTAGRNGGRMTRFDPDEFSLLIVDEAHHATSPSYRAVIDHYRQNENLRILGLTATPDRADERALGEVFETVPFEFDISDGIANGWLVRPVQQAVHIEGLDFSNIRTTAGDLNGKDLAAVLEFEENLHEMTTPILDLCEDRKTLIFTVTVAQAERMAEILNRHKSESAEYVCGTTPKEYRRQLFERYAAGDFQYLANVGVTTEGFDEPGIQDIVVARPTKSRSLFAQMLGRGTRTLAGTVDGIEDAEERKRAIAESDKPCMHVLDFVGNAGRHKLIHPADILGGKYSDEIVELANRNIEREGKPADIATELMKAEREFERRIRDRREAEKRQQLKLKSRYTTTTINPFDVLDIVPSREPNWHKGRMPTEGQVGCLEKFGIQIPEGLTFVHASQLIDRLIKRRGEKLCSYKQAKLLDRYGYDGSTITFQNAGELITAIAENGWKRPKEEPVSA